MRIDIETIRDALKSAHDVMSEDRDAWINSSCTHTGDGPSLSTMTSEGREFVEEYDEVIAKVTAALAMLDQSAWD